MKRVGIVSIAIIFFVIAGGIAFGAESEKEKWPGVDEALVRITAFSIITAMTYI